MSLLGVLLPRPRLAGCLLLGLSWCTLLLLHRGLNQGQKVKKKSYNFFYKKYEKIIT
jgi:hypothetical protein